MPWKEYSLMEERFRFVEEWKCGDWDMAELCRFYEIARGTGYKWVGRFEAGGIDALRDLSRAPHVHPNAVSQEIEDLVIAVRDKHPKLAGVRPRFGRG